MPSMLTHREPSSARFARARALRGCVLLLSLFAQLWVACDADSPREAEPAWQVVASELDEAVLAVGGSSSRDVWAVGADKGQGPLVLHWDGSTWTRVPTGSHGDLWWVHGFADGTALFGGGQGTL